MEKLTFADFDLPVKILDVLADLELFEPTPIQEKSLKPILSGRDVMGIAQTGTGKTLAYLLPVLKAWKYSKTGNPTVLVLVPTRELVVQVTEILEKLTENITARVIDRELRRNAHPETGRVPPARCQQPSRFIEFDQRQGRSHRKKCCVPIFRRNSRISHLACEARPEIHCDGADL